MGTSMKIVATLMFLQHAGEVKSASWEIGEQSRSHQAKLIDLGA